MEKVGVRERRVRQKKQQQTGGEAEGGCETGTEHEMKREDGERGITLEHIELHLSGGIWLFT